MNCGIGCRHGLDLALLWLWCRPAATAPIRPLAWEPPYATERPKEIAKTHTHEKKKSTIIMRVTETSSLIVIEQADRKSIRTYSILTIPFVKLDLTDFFKRTNINRIYILFKG